MESFQDGPVIVELSQGSIQGDKEGIVDTRMSNIVTESSHQEGKGVEGAEHSCNGVAWFCVGFTFDLVWREKSNLKEKVEDGLKYIDDVAEVVVKYKVIIGFSACHDEDRELVCS